MHKSGIFAPLRGFSAELRSPATPRGRSPNPVFFVGGQKHTLLYAQQKQSLELEPVVKLCGLASTHYRSQRTWQWARDRILHSRGFRGAFMRLSSCCHGAFHEVLDEAVMGYCADFMGPRCELYLGMPMCWLYFICRPALERPPA